MPLNLAQTAISVLRLGENALTAIYSGIVRVYPNEVTVSIDGANASTQSGTPGQSMNNLIYTVNPSSGSTSGWTAAQISAATLTGLPAGFTATFSASGGLGSQVGTWSIITSSSRHGYSCRIFNIYNSSNRLGFNKCFNSRIILLE